ncbi:hypothetical protein QAD02_005333 [Eretmocerus hayati]|uniref:Uncharacterized protein n=1 Tax=Eretmocerus hayati TaxID=131215 RepID=A0ACC2NT85_9HYME|nr:hypothetical protein QAD02_005333 [Eretmocerus hayati]
MYRSGCNTTSTGSLCEGKESFYKKMLELQDKLRKSEEERIRLEERFKLLTEESKIRHQACINRLRMRYVEFLEEQRARDERNGKLLNALDRVDTSLVLMTAKTERLNMLRSMISSEPCILSSYRLPVSNWDSVSRRLDFHLAEREPSTALLTSLNPPAPTIPIVEPPVPAAASTPENDLDPLEALRKLSFLSPPSPVPQQQQKLDGYLNKIRDQLEHESRESSEQNTSGDLLNASPFSEDEEAVAGQRRQSFASLRSLNLDDPRRIIQQNNEMLAAMAAEDSADDENDGIEDDYDHSVDIDTWMPDDQDVDVGELSAPSKSESRLRPRTKLESIEEVEPSEDEEQAAPEKDPINHAEMPSQKLDVDEFDLRLEEMKSRIRRNSMIHQQQANHSFGNSDHQENQHQLQSGQRQEYHEDATDLEETVDQKMDQEYSEQVIQQQQQHQYSENYNQQPQLDAYSDDTGEKQTKNSNDSDQQLQEQHPDPVDSNRQPSDHQQHSAEDLEVQQIEQQQYQYSEDPNQVTTDQQQYNYSEDSNQQQYQYSEDPNQQQYEPSTDPNQSQIDQQLYQYSEDPNQQKTDQQQYAYPEDPNQQQEDQQQYQYSEDPNQQQYQYSEDPNQQYAYDANATYADYGNQQYADGQYTEYTEQQYQQYDQEYQQYEYSEYTEQPQQMSETGSNEQQAEDYSQAYEQRSADQTQSAEVLEHSQSENVDGGSEQPEKAGSTKTTSGSSRPATGTANKSKEKKKDVIASILDSDSESFIERNLSNTESDFDFN